MSDASVVGLSVLGFLAAALLFVCELALAVLLSAVNALSRVALRSMGSDSTGGLRFAEELRGSHSTRRAALHAGREASLVGASFAFALGARDAGWPHPWLLGGAAGLLVGVILLEALAARAIALRDPRAALRATAFLIVPVHALFYPAVAPIEAIVRRGAAGRPSAGPGQVGDDEQEVDAFIEVGEREGILEAGEGRMVRGIVDLGETRVREIMTPRTDIVAVPAESTLAEARKVLLRTAHSRLPVFRGTIDNVVGILHVRDLLKAMDDGLDASSVTACVRPPFFVPETQPIADLLAPMRTRTQIALVVDEYGGLAGLVTLEDLLEEIVGDIRDEHEPEATLLQQLPDGSWSISGLAHVEELERLFGIGIDERDFDTVGGLVVSVLGRVPAKGESFEAHGLRMEVLEADRRRVYRVRVLPSRRAIGDAGDAP